MYNVLSFCRAIDKHIDSIGSANATKNEIAWLKWGSRVSRIGPPLVNQLHIYHQAFPRLPYSQY